MLKTKVLCHIKQISLIFSKQNNKVRNSIPYKTLLANQIAGFQIK